MSETNDLPIKLNTGLKQSDLKRGDVFLWRSRMSGRYEIHTFHSDSGYGVKTFTGYNEEDGSSEIVNWSGVCGVIVAESDEDLEAKILVDGGDMFDGTRFQFMNCYFSNADDDQITDWCKENNWSLKINGKVILE